MDKSNYVPQSLDEQERYLVFTPDELVGCIVPIVVGTLIANFAIGLAGACAIFWGLRKLKKGGGLSRLMTAAYWLLPPGVVKLKATPASHLRQLAG